MIYFREVVNTITGKVMFEILLHRTETGKGNFLHIEQSHIHSTEVDLSF